MQFLCSHKENVFTLDIAPILDHNNIREDGTFPVDMGKTMRKAKEMAEGCTITPVIPTGPKTV